MDTIKTIRTQDEQGQISDNIYIEVDAINVDLNNGSNVQETVDNINTNIISINNNISNLEERVNSDCEKIENKVTSINENSTDAQYPSAKCVYDLIGNAEALLDILIGEEE